LLKRSGVGEEASLETGGGADTKRWRKAAERCMARVPDMLAGHFFYKGDKKQKSSLITINVSQNSRLFP